MPVQPPEPPEPPSPDSLETPDDREASAGPNPGVLSAGRLAQTLRDAAGGDEHAWEVLVEAYTRRIFGLLVRQCRDRELAEEITQATFVKVVTTLADYSGYEERGKFEPWLFRIAMNQLRDEMRRRRRQAVSMGSAGGRDTDPSDQAVAPFGTAPASDPFEAATRGEQIERLAAAVAKLSEPDRQVLYLRHTATLSFAQIAETLGEPLGTVLARCHRALGKLRLLMTDPSEKD